MDLIKQTYYNNGSYLRARANDVQICALIQQIKDGTLSPSFVENGGTINGNVTVNGDLTVNGTIYYQSINTNSINICDYSIACDISGLLINTNLSTVSLYTDLLVIGDEDNSSTDTIASVYGNLDICGTIFTENLETNTLKIYDLSVNNMIQLTGDLEVFVGDISVYDGELYVNGNIDTSGSLYVDNTIYTNNINITGTLNTDILECNTLTSTNTYTQVLDCSQSQVIDLDASNINTVDLSASNIDVSGNITINGFPLNQIYNGLLDVSNGMTYPFTITFPQPYTTTPVVLLSLRTNVTIPNSSASRIPYITNLTTTTCTVACTNSIVNPASDVPKIFWVSMPSQS